MSFDIFSTELRSELLSVQCYNDYLHIGIYRQQTLKVDKIRAWKLINCITLLGHSRTQSPSYARSTERDKGLWPNPYQTGI